MYVVVQLENEYVAHVHSVSHTGIPFYAHCHAPANLQLYNHVGLLTLAHNDQHSSNAAVTVLIQYMY